MQLTPRTTKRLGFGFFIALVCFIAFNIFTTPATNADATSPSFTPGSADDPVVTKSYVDKKVGEINQTPGTPQPGNGAETISLKLEAGQTLMAHTGAQVLVRTGTATIVTTDGNGVPDATGGKDLSNGTVVPLNHLLLFPRDGRGLTPHGDKAGNVWVMVTGKYTLAPNSK